MANKHCINDELNETKTKRMIPEYDKLESKLNSINSHWLGTLSDNLDMINVYFNPLPEYFTRKNNLVNEIDTFVKHMFPNAEVVPYGASENGFSTRQSDVDISVNVNQNYCNFTPRYLVLEYLNDILRILRNSTLITSFELISKARFPVIRFTSTNDIKGDISINNIFAIENTKLLKLYSQLDPLVIQLGIILKYMTKNFGIAEVFNGGLSSYAYNLMLIHFLQQQNYLPVLQELYEGSKPSCLIQGHDVWYQYNLSTIKKLWKPKLKHTLFDKIGLGETWIAFLKYYVIDFEIMNQVISIKQLKPLYKSENGWKMSFIAIEDPFLTTSNLGQHLSYENYRHILKYFRKVLMDKGELPDTWSLSKQMAFYESSSRHIDWDHDKNADYYDECSSYLSDEEEDYSELDYSEKEQSFYIEEEEEDSEQDEDEEETDNEDEDDYDSEADYNQEEDYPYDAYSYYDQYEIIQYNAKEQFIKSDDEYYYPLDDFSSFIDDDEYVSYNAGEQFIKSDDEYYYPQENDSSSNDEEDDFPSSNRWDQFVKIIRDTWVEEISPKPDDNEESQ